MSNTNTVTYAYETTTSHLKSVTDALSRVKTYSYAKDPEFSARYKRITRDQRRLVSALADA